MLDLTFLTKEDVFGNRYFCNKLYIIKKCGTKCVATDFARLLGQDHYLIDGKSMGSWWTQTAKNGDQYNYSVNIVDGNGTIYWIDTYYRYVGGRPSFDYSLLKEPVIEIKEENDIKEIIYGEYPQWVVDENYSSKLESKYKSGILKETGKKYTTDSVVIIDDEELFAGLKVEGDIIFQPRKHIEYEDDGIRYIRIEGSKKFENTLLSDGRHLKANEPYWIKVEPIVWLVHEKECIALSKYILFSGVMFRQAIGYNNNFKNTDIKQFMDEYLSKEIECRVYNEKLIENKQVDIDSIFEDTIKRMNEINEMEKTKIKILK